MDHQPFHLDAIATDLLLHASDKRVLVLPFGAFVVIALASEINRRRLVHVGLPLVVAEHHLAIQLQLRTKAVKSRSMRTQPHLEVDAVGSGRRTCSSSTHEQCQ